MQSVEPNTELAESYAKVDKKLGRVGFCLMAFSLASTGAVAAAITVPAYASNEPFYVCFVLAMTATYALSEGAVQLSKYYDALADYEEIERAFIDRAAKLTEDAHEAIALGTQPGR